MSNLEVTSRLEELHEHKATQSMTPDLQKDYLKKTERSRHLLAWGDHSTILSHGYLLYMITSIYDEAIYITNEEAQIRGLRIQEVQACVEKPQIHIIARTAGSETATGIYGHKKWMHPGIVFPCWDINWHSNQWRDAILWRWQPREADGIRWTTRGTPGL